MSRPVRSAILVLIPLCTLLLSVPAAAQPQVGSFGFGIIIPDPAGLTAKGSIGRSNAWDFAIGTGYLGSLRLHGDYLWNINAFSSSEVGLYLGLGGVIGSGKGNGIIVKKKAEDDESFRLGLRGVVGISAMPFNPPLELFFEVAPIVRLIPSGGTGTDIALGIRYYP